MLGERGFRPSEAFVPKGEQKPKGGTDAFAEYQIRAAALAAVENKQGRFASVLEEASKEAAEEQFKTNENPAKLSPEDGDEVVVFDASGKKEGFPADTDDADLKDDDEEYS